MSKDWVRVHHSLKDILEEWAGREKGVMPCPGCGVNASMDCGYGIWDNGEFDCLDPDNDGEPCDYCHHLYCNDCKLKNTMEFKEEEFDVS